MTDTNPERIRCRRGRATASLVMIVAGSVLLPIAGLTVWVRNQVLSTDRYVETVAPLASDPAVQTAVTDRVATRVTEALDLRALAADVLDDVSPRAEPLAGVIAAGAENAIRDTTRRVLESDAFQTVWERANRIAHSQVVDVLTGREGAALTTEEGRVVLQLGPLAERVTAELEDRFGFELPADATQRLDDVRYTLFVSEDLARARRATELLDRLTWITVALAPGLFVLGVVVARDRRRAFSRVGIGIAVASVVALVAFAFARIRYLDALPPTANRPAADAAFETLTRFVRGGFRTLAVLGLVLVAFAWLAGPSPAATRIRAAARSLAPRGEPVEGEIPEPGPVPRWVAAHAAGLRATIAVLALAALVAWERPTGLAVLGVAVAALLSAALVEVVASTARPADAAAERAGG
jgi:hypothetical protein